MANLQIKSTTTRTETKEIEVALPYFCKHQEFIYKVINKEKVIRVYNGEYYSTISGGVLEMYSTEIARSVVCSEVEFIQTMESAVNRIIEKDMVHGGFDEVSEEEKNDRVEAQLYTLNSAS